MYELYKHDKWIRLFPGLLFMVPVIAFPFGAYNDYKIRGFSINTVLFIVFALLFLFIAVIMLIPINPYVHIEKWKKENPALVKAMEEDFFVSTEFCYRIFKGQRFYFFKTFELFVIPIGQITSITVKKAYHRRIGNLYKVTFTSAEGSVTLDVPLIIQTREETMKYLIQMAFESGITVKMPQ